MTLAQFAEMVKTPRINCVMLSACHSSKFGQTLVDAGVPSVVSIDFQNKVLVSANRLFVRTFVKDLVQGESVRVAHANAKKVISSDPSFREEQEHNKFILNGCHTCLDRPIFNYTVEAEAGEDCTHVETKTPLREESLYILFDRLFELNLAVMFLGSGSSSFLQIDYRTDSN